MLLPVSQTSAENLILLLQLPLGPWAVADCLEAWPWPKLSLKSRTNTPSSRCQLGFVQRVPTCRTNLVRPFSRTNTSCCHRASFVFHDGAVFSVSKSSLSSSGGGSSPASAAADSPIIYRGLYSYYFHFSSLITDMFVIRVRVRVFLLSDPFRESVSVCSKLIG